MSTNPEEDPEIIYNYLQHEDDIAAWRRCIRLTREIIAQPAMDPFRGEELQPGAAVVSDAEIDQWVRENIESAYHPCGTCRMGPAESDTSVVDEACRVIGLDGLRVVDASVFPTIPYGNINAPTIMVAEKASDLILGHPPLPRETTATWLPADWETNQRERSPIRNHAQRL